jgi:prepilin peptidase CpaA
MNPNLDMIDWVRMGLVILLLSASAYTELTRNKIPNQLTYPAIILGLILGYLPAGISWGASLGGFGIGFGMMFMFYLFGGLGGGDVKLMAAFGALLGFPLIVRVLLFSSFFGAIMAVVLLTWNANPAKFLKRKTLPAEGPDESPEAPPDEAAKGEPESTRPRTIPFGIAICTGVLFSLFSALES